MFIVMTVARWQNLGGTVYGIPATVSPPEESDGFCLVFDSRERAEAYAASFDNPPEIMEVRRRNQQPDPQDADTGVA